MRKILYVFVVIYVLPGGILNFFKKLRFLHACVFDHLVRMIRTLLTVKIFFVK
jgi:hypothetical protein